MSIRRSPVSGNRFLPRPSFYPGYLLLLAHGIDAIEGVREVLWGHALVIVPSGYVIQWVLFPLVMSGIAGAIDRDDRYIGYIVAFNWSNVVQMAVTLPVAAIVASADHDALWVAVLRYTLLVGLLAYSWFIARAMLDIRGIAAAAIVAMDYILKYVIVFVMLISILRA